MVAILFARKDSIYKQLPNCEVYDIERDARTFAGGMPVVAHPPCRAWGRLRTFSKPSPGEQSLAWYALDQVRKEGGVLEHPESSLLWRLAGLPMGSQRDWWGGWTMKVHQSWWGHRCKKPTFLYIVGVEPREVPPVPLSFDAITHVVSCSKKGKWKKHIGKPEREHTPPALAEWLVALAKKVKQ